MSLFFYLFMISFEFSFNYDITPIKNFEKKYYHLIKTKIILFIVILFQLLQNIQGIIIYLEKIIMEVDLKYKIYMYMKIYHKLNKILKEISSIMLKQILFLVIVVK